MASTMKYAEKIWGGQAVKDPYELSRLLAELASLRQDRERLREALSESELRFRFVFESVSSAILMLSKDGRVLIANANALSLLGLDESIIGQTLEGNLPHAAKLLPFITNRGRHRLEIETADGKSRMLGFSSEPVKLSEGMGFIAVFQDESLLYRAEQRRRRAEQLAYVGELAARLSHELKNPMATIKTGLKVIDRQVDLEPEDAKLLRTVISEVEGVSDIITGLLGAARHEEFNPVQSSLTAVVQDLCDRLFLRVAKAARKNIEISMPDYEINVVVDKKAFDRALGNLVSNALESLGQGGVIRIECEELSEKEADDRFPGYQGKVARVKVTDNGPGIPENILPKIFKPFFTTKDSGTGLGLPVTRDIVDSHGGYITVSSQPQKGTTFEIFLPAGERPPCWEWVVYHEWDFYYGEDRCQTCEIHSTGSGYLCWMRRLGQDEAAEDTFEQRCASCPVYLNNNLGHFYRKGS